MRQDIKRCLFYGIWLLKFSALMVFFLIVSLPLRFARKYDNLWLISERPDEARDNGYWLYKWILEHKPDTNVRYVLAKHSVDYAKMPRKDLIIEPGSAKHYIYYILSSLSISTHMHGACPGKSFVIPFLPFVRRKKTIFLQHGIIKNRIKLRGGLDAIIASSKKEAELIVEANPRYINNVHIVGLCRYDQLANASADSVLRYILVMPTFRKYLRDIGRLKDSGEFFRRTDYYVKWNSFLNDDELDQLLKKHNVRLLFFPHKDMQELAQNFESKSSAIKIGKPGEYDVQTLLKEASILVTDYSSVFFDFVYMNKPVLFYQFDQKDFFSRHYKSSGKPYPFGDIFNDEKKLIEELENTILRNYTMKKKYEKDAKDFYEYRDTNNCQRNFDLINSLTRKTGGVLDGEAFK